MASPAVRVAALVASRPKRDATTIAPPPKRDATTGAPPVGPGRAAGARAAAAGRAAGARAAAAGRAAGARAAAAGRPAGAREGSWRRARSAQHGTPSGERALAKLRNVRGLRGARARFLAHLRHALSCISRFFHTYACSVRTPTYRRTYVRFRVPPASRAAAARARLRQGLRLPRGPAVRAPRTGLPLLRRRAQRGLCGRSSSRSRRRPRPASRIGDRPLRHGAIDHRPQRPAGGPGPALLHADDVEQAHGRAAPVERPPRLSARRVPAPLTRRTATPAGARGTARQCRRVPIMAQAHGDAPPVQRPPRLRARRVPTRRRRTASPAAERPPRGSARRVPTRRGRTATPRRSNDRRASVPGSSSTANATHDRAARGRRPRSAPRPRVAAGRTRSRRRPVTRKVRYAHSARHHHRTHGRPSEPRAIVAARAVRYPHSARPTPPREGGRGCRMPEPPGSRRGPRPAPRTSARAPPSHGERARFAPTSPLAGGHCILPSPLRDAVSARTTRRHTRATGGITRQPRRATRASITPPPRATGVWQHTPRAGHRGVAAHAPTGHPRCQHTTATAAPGRHHTPRPTTGAEAPHARVAPLSESHPGAPQRTPRATRAGAPPTANDRRTTRRRSVVLKKPAATYSPGPLRAKYHRR